MEYFNFNQIVPLSVSGCQLPTDCPRLILLRFEHVIAHDRILLILTSTALLEKIIIQGSLSRRQGRGILQIVHQPISNLS